MNFEEIFEGLQKGELDIRQALNLAHDSNLSYGKIRQLKALAEKLDVNEIAGLMEDDEPAPTAPPKPKRAPAKPTTTPVKPSRPSPFRPTKPKVVPKPKAKAGGPAAPAKPKPRTKPTTTPAKPSRPDPFRPTKPKVVPKPKAKGEVVESSEISMIGNMITEAYEDEAHPSTQEFWRDLPRNREHVYGKHPILAMYGDKLSREAHQFTSDKAERAGGRVDMHEMMGLVMQIMQIEAQHQEELVDLAKDITVKIWGIDRDMLRGELTQQIDPGDDDDDHDDEEEVEGEVPEELRQQINKRITMNTMTQGSAVHAMFSMHHLVDRAIERISPQLLQLYNRISAGSVYHYWMIDIPRIAEMLRNMKAGESEVEFDEGGDPMVVGRGMVFPVLCQELSKGVMELITMHGLEGMDEGSTRTVLHHADKLVDEPWLIQVGPALWRRFLKVVPKKARMADVVMALSKQEPDHVHKIVNAVVEKPEEATELLQELIREPEAFDVEEYGEEDDEFGGYDDGYDEEEDEEDLREPRLR